MEKRRYARRHCALPIELRTQSSSFPLKAETSDLSPCGCYISMLSTLPVGTVLDIVLWAGELKLSFQGTVKTADAAVGNGVEFTGISKEQAAQLGAYLDEIHAPLANSDYIFH
jgi:hypothetical protein